MADLRAYLEMVGNGDNGDEDRDTDNRDSGNVERGQGRSPVVSVSTQQVAVLYEQRIAVLEKGHQAQIAAKEETIEMLREQIAFQQRTIEALIGRSSEQGQQGQGHGDMSGQVDPYANTAANSGANTPESHRMTRTATLDGVGDKVAAPDSAGSYRTEASGAQDDKVTVQPAPQGKPEGTKRHWWRIWR
jgi:hypothetical protein